MFVKITTNDLRANFLRFVSTLHGHIANRKWPWKKLSQMAYFTTISLIIILSIKFTLRGIPLRNSMKLTDASSRLLDISNFEWLMNNKTICAKEPNTANIMVVLVHTARDHFEERKAIRDTWGSLKSYKNWSIRVIFLLGRSDPNSESGDQISKQMSTEFQNHGDMVMGSFTDKYKNLTYKHLMGYKWILNYCPEATYVWKVDDDVFLDPLTIVEWRQAEMDKVKGSADIKRSTKMFDMYCGAIPNSKPQRDPSLKWFVSHETWPSSMYPPYCSGWFYGINVPWIRNIFSASESAKHALWIDDLFVTGILVQIVKMEKQETPLVKNIWPYSTFDYDPANTTFCLDKSMTTNNVPETKRRFGAFGRLLRGRTLVHESKCIWKNIISKKWQIMEID